MEFVDLKRANPITEPRFNEDEGRARSEPPAAPNAFEVLDDPSHLGQIEAERYFGYPSAEEVQATLEDRSIHSTGQIQSPEQNLALLSSTSPTSHKRGPSNLFSSPTLLNPMTSPNIAVPASWPFKNENEAKLFHYYIKEVTPWVRYRVHLFNVLR